MKKLFLTLVMIISTGIVVYAIMFYEPSDIEAVKSYIYNKKSEEYNENFTETYKMIRKENMKDKTLKEEELSNNKDIKEGFNIENETDLKVSVESKIFKLDYKEIESRLSKDEREKIERIIKKISSVDLITIKEKFQKYNKEENFKEGFNLIKKRISVKDYEEMKKILYKYIDFTILEI